ncbi:MULTISPECIES: hypothetical protein [Microbacterium]|uniref:hypothetical protein n=1 Tax=Microbacterium TaxID=33882 RepID=UPI00278608C1|nr:MULTISPECIES: hypothetical protein [Microbacterium]MDQ1084374.1 putative GNAT superfamily acetyltransferase [Microbacterium sp. SORGH_AS_0344]MDQ1170351.1 putative GNAT superfamily acetyltransferase [Microbacterium proteolyticum]
MTAQVVAPGSVPSAASAAERAAVRVRPVTDAEGARAAIHLVNDVWGPDNRIASVGLLVALAHTGNHVAIAEDADGIAGVCAGFLHADDPTRLHSHVAATRPGTSGRGIGLALKLQQRDWALERGVAAITWTFDPLVRRNAHFNLTRLGAQGVAYLPDLYGPMQDAVNLGEPSDRLEVRWELDAPRAPAANTVAPAALDDADGLPVVTALPSRGERIVHVPADIEGLRVIDPRRAHRWRLAVREVLAGALSEGWRIDGFVRNAGYVLRKD